MLMTPLALLAALQALDGQAWETTKGVLITLGSTAAIGAFSLAVNLTLKVRDLTHHIVGIDGKNGIKSKVNLLVERVDVLEEWKIATEAIADAERQQWPHPDRRTGPRRLRDVAHEVQDERARRMTDEHSVEGLER